ncbi:unnamed protein product [Arctogadus glacialis]
MKAMEWIQTLLLSGLCVPSFCADYRQHCLIETPKSWSDARSYCRERGYDLATIDDMGAIKSLLALNADRAHDELWIGLHYGAPVWRWQWSLADKDFYQEGERDYRNFNGGAGRFAVQLNSGKWIMQGASKEHRFVCYDGNRQGGDRYVLVRYVMSWTWAKGLLQEAPHGPGTRKWVLKVKVHSEDIQELNDPAMKTAILKQTQQLLNEATSGNHHKMMWKTNSDGQVFTKEQCPEEDGNV